MVAPLMRRRDLFLLAGITAVAAIIRFGTLGVQSFDHDEAVTAARVIHPGLFDTLSVVAHGERSPPLYYLLAWGWSKPFGTGELGLRSLSALLGAVTVPLVYIAALELSSRRRIALLSAALVALNPYLVWYSQEARSYALMVFFVALTLVYFARCLKRPSPGSLALWALASALAIGSHYFAVFLIGPEAVWLLLSSRASRPAFLAVAAVVAVGLALIPLAVTQEGSGRRNGFEQIPLPSRVAETGLNFVASEEPTPLAGTTEIDAVQALSGTVAVLLLAAALALLATRGSSQEQWAAGAAGVVAGAAIAIPVLLAIIGIDFINPRNLIGALIPLLIVGAIGFGCRAAGRVGVLGSAGACALFVGVLVAVNASSQMQRPDWRGAAEALGPASSDRIFVVPHNGDDPLAYYLQHAHKPHHLSQRVFVSQIDVLSTNNRVKPPSGRFTLVSKQGIAPFFLLWRYQAKQRQQLRLRQLAGHRVLSERSSILVGD
jgi:mannosyltransferase